MSFPASVKVDEWLYYDGTPASNAAEYVKTPIGLWVKQLVIGSGGIGIGVGVTLSFFLFVSLCVYCCCRDRCCKAGIFQPLCFAHYTDSVPDGAQAGKRKMLGAYCVCLLVSVICMGAIAQGAAKGMDGIDSGLRSALTFIDDAQDFACSGSIDVTQAKGCSAQAKATRKSDCTETSLDRFLADGGELVVGLLDYTLDLSKSLTGNIANNLETAEEEARAVNASVHQLSVLLEQIEEDTVALKAQAAVLVNPTTDVKVVEDSQIPDVSANLQGARDGACMYASHTVN